MTAEEHTDEALQEALAGAIASGDHDAVAVFHRAIDARRDGPVGGTPLKPFDAMGVNLVLRENAEMLSRRVEVAPGINATTLIAKVRGDEMDLWRAKRLLLENGYIDQRHCGECPSHHYHSVTPYRVATDPDAEPRPALEDRLMALCPDLVDPLVAYGEVRLVYEHGAVRLDVPAHRWDH